MTPTFELTDDRASRVGDMAVRRALPQRARRTVGAWCFVDHMGPAAVTEDRGVDVAPHPHLGLQTVTWLLEGEVVHRDSLGNEQVIRPGELNLMTAGRGIAHSEEHTGHYRGDVHGVQLWVAQPSATRDGTSAFEHHADLPRVELPGAVATVLVGDLEGAASTARRDTDHVGFDLALEGGESVVPLRTHHEHALIVTAGDAVVDGTPVVPGQLAYLGTGRDELAVTGDRGTRVLLIGGVPFDENVVMWWNVVARTRDEITDAWRSWQDADERFPAVASTLPRTVVDAPPWHRNG
jgi:hypothetical protein